MKKLTIAYFGTPSFSAHFLEKILKDKTLPVEVKLVVTQPERPVGRRQILTPSPVKQIAEKYKIEVATGGTAGRAPASVQRFFQPVAGREHLREGKLGQNLLQQFDLILVCAYGQLIPKDLLSIPKYGFWNIHYSLLPKYRGASPVAYALIAGEKKTGVTIFQMDEKIDHGPIIAQEEAKILPYERRPDLEIRLTDFAFEMFKKLLILTDFNRLQLTAQADHLATYTKRLTKQDGFVEISKLKSQNSNPNSKIYNLFRGLYPWPGVWTILPNGKRLKIINMDRSLHINRVQLEGKKEVDFATFRRTYKIFD